MQGQLVIDDALYPKFLRQIRKPPKVLYYKGNLDPTIFENCLAVVGSRRMTSYGRRVVKKLLYDLVATGVTIVSGFMYGIDACAHEAALAVGGRTIAVMPCGIDYIHPENQEDLYNQVLENNGLVLSETAGELKPQI